MYNLFIYFTLSLSRILPPSSSQTTLRDANHTNHQNTVKQNKERTPSRRVIQLFNPFIASILLLLAMVAGTANGGFEGVGPVSIDTSDDRVHWFRFHHVTALAY